MNNMPMITAEYYPMIPRESIAANCTKKMNLKDLSSLGSAFSVVASAFARAAMQQPNTEGLYRCVYPEGVTGKLAEFRDGSGKAGAIMNNGRIQAQARWVPVDGKSVSVGVDPVSIAVAVALMNINRKLDTIAEMQKEILNFLQQDKESKLEGAVNSLSDILENYRFQSENSVWRGSQLTVVSTIKGTAEQNIIFYRRGMKAVIEDQSELHSAQDAANMKEALQHKIKYYQLSVYLYAYSSFLEVLLAGNYAKEFLSHITGKLQEYAMQYQVDYKECCSQLESYKEKSIEHKVLEFGGVIGKGLGGLIAKIPLISEGSVDEALISIGDSLTDHGKKRAAVFLSDFETNRDSGIQLFAESIASIDVMANKPVELMFDKENIYICSAQENG